VDHFKTLAGIAVGGCF